MKFFIITVISLNVFSAELHSFQAKANISQSSGRAKIFPNENYNYHYKCGANTNLNKNDYVFINNQVAYSSIENGENGISFLLPDGTIKFITKDKNKLGSDKINFEIDGKKYTSYLANSGRWMLSNGTNNEAGYKQVEPISIDSQSLDQAKSYESQLTAAIDKYALKVGKSNGSMFSEDQVTNCAKFAGKSGNNDFKISLKKIADYESKEAKRGLASETDTLINRDSLGGEGATGSGTGTKSIAK